MKRIFTVWIIAILVFAGLTLAACDKTNLTVPSTVAADCSRDVTTQLNSYLANVPADSTINLQSGACYTVSNTSNVLTVANLDNVTINGNGATFKQSSYNGGDCSTDVNQPIVRLTGNTNLSVNGVTLQGPSQCGGAGTEGGYGIEMGGTDNGNSGVTLSDITVKDTAGDGLAIMPDLGTAWGVNTNIAVTGSTFDNIGYHVLTLEGVNGLNYSHNTVTNSGQFADLEVDSDCGCPPGYVPTGAGQDNVTISDNTFTNASSQDVWISELQGACIPLHNFVITNNTLDSTVDPDIELGGGESATCHDSGLTITGNTSTYPAHSPCGGSVADSPPLCAVWEVSDFDNVQIELNQLNVFDGVPGYGDNTLLGPCVALAGVNTATVAGNYCHNAWAAVTLGGWGMQFNPQDLAVTGLTHCWNTWGLTDPVDGATANVQHEASC